MNSWFALDTSHSYHRFVPHIAPRASFGKTKLIRHLLRSRPKGLTGTPFSIVIYQELLLNSPSLAQKELHSSLSELVILFKNFLITKRKNTL